MIYVYRCLWCEGKVELQRKVAQIDDPVRCGFCSSGGGGGGGGAVGISAGISEQVFMVRIRFHKGTGVHFKGEGWPGKDNAGRRNWQRNQDITEEFNDKVSKQKPKKEGTYDDPAPAHDPGSTFGI